MLQGIQAVCQATQGVNLVKEAGTVREASLPWTHLIKWGLKSPHLICFIRNHFVSL